jgi:hypothetical protein
LFGPKSIKKRKKSYEGDEGEEGGENERREFYDSLWRFFERGNGLLLQGWRAVDFLCWTFFKPVYK